MQATKLTKHQHRLWSSMLRTIETFKTGNISFPELVVALEGTFEAGEFRDRSLVERFYNLWQPLEITNAIKGIHATGHDVARDIQAMENFLVEYLVEDEIRKT